MEKNLRPAHEVILDGIEKHCRNITFIDQSINTGDLVSGGRIVPVNEIMTSRAVNIGGLCGLLEVLPQMVIPEEALDGVIARLKGITLRHVLIWSTIRDLEERKS